MRNGMCKGVGALELYLIFLLVPATAMCQQPAAPGAPAPGAASHPTLAIGSPAPDFSLPGIDGKTHRLNEYAGKPVLAVLFTCVHCPTSQLYESRVQRLYDDYRNRGVAFVAINPNDPAAATHAELAYTDVVDDLEGMQARAQHRRITYPFLFDGQTQAATRLYGPVTTPQLFIFGKDRKLQYVGRLDDNQRESQVKVQEARAALEAILAGKPVPVAHTTPFGCPINWKEQARAKAQQVAKIAAEPVTVNLVTAGELKTLRANAGAKMLMVNFWATWCGPCIEEMPHLLETYYWYRSRGFDFVTVSANYPDERTGVLKTLQSLHVTTRNLLFGSEDTSSMQAAFDKSWQAGVPFTMVIAPGGKVIYQEQGEISILRLRRAILVNLDDGAYAGLRAYWSAR
jgi:thiol-disulfide isomerase/thioredoxin